MSPCAASLGGRLGATSTTSPARAPLLITLGCGARASSLPAPIEVAYASLTLNAGDAGFGLLVTVWGTRCVVLGSLDLRPLAGAASGALLLSGGTLGVGLAYLGFAVCAVAVAGMRSGVPTVIRRINNALMRADQVHHMDGKNGVYWMAPIIADAEAGFGGSLNAFELMKAMIEAGAACVHFEDQLSSAKKCGHLGGKVLVPTSEAIQKLIAARLAADVLGVPTLIMARTDADSAHLLTSDIDPRDREFLTGERTPEGFFGIRGGLESAIARAISYAPYADLIWCETSHPDLDEARQFAEAVHAKFPGKMLAYNCSPSFNWKKNLDDRTIANFQRELGRMGYKFQFVTLAGFHALNLSMFELARGYKDSGMTAYSRLQEKEFARESQYGYQAVKHQRFVGTGYFDALTQVIAAGQSSTTALAGSTEQEQFSEIKPQFHPKHGPDAGCQPILGDCPHLVSEIMPNEEALLPSGD